MRLLCINPNTTPQVTERITAMARAIVPQGWEVRGATGRFGARYISSRAASAIAAHAALDLYADHASSCDIVLLACFGDPGLAALKEIAAQPVIGLAEASCHHAVQQGHRFSIVTGGLRWESMLREFVDWLGLSTHLASVRAVAPTGGQIAADPDGALALLASACNDCAEKDGAETVILAGAGLVGLAARIQDRVRIPVLCSVDTGIRAAVALAGTKGSRPTQTKPVESVELTPALASLLIE